MEFRKARFAGGTRQADAHVVFRRQQVASAADAAEGIVMQQHAEIIHRAAEGLLAEQMKHHDMAACLSDAGVGIEGVP